jgi:hypothetical protein
MSACSFFAPVVFPPVRTPPSPPKRKTPKLKTTHTHTERDTQTKKKVPTDPTDGGGGFKNKIQKKRGEKRKRN